jgi:hypothetical protein
MQSRFLAAAITTLVSSMDAYAVTVNDGDFSSWVPFSFVTDDPAITDPGPATSSGTATRVTSGGNPGAYYEANHTFTTGDGVVTGGIKTDFEYDPATQGPLKNLAVSASLLHTPKGSSAWQFVIEQDGRRYYSFPYAVFEANAAWARVKKTNLNARNFDTNSLAGIGGVQPDGNSPNLTGSGGRIRFGFAFSNTVTNGVDTLTNQLGLDNFLVSTSLAPTASIAASVPSGSEGGEFPQFLIGIDAIQNKPTVVTYKIGGTAKNGQDYKKLTGQAKIAAGATSATITIKIKDDLKKERTETVKLKLTASPSYNIDPTGKSASVEILDND